MIVIWGVTAWGWSIDLSWIAVSFLLNFQLLTRFVGKYRAGHQPRHRNAVSLLKSISTSPPITSPEFLVDQPRF